MNLTKLGQKHVVTARRETTIGEAARLMREHHVGDVVVVEARGGRTVPVGMLTDRDIVIATIALGASMAALEVGDVMSPDLVVAQENESLGHLIDLMREHGLKRVPIVDRSGSLVGIISFADVMALLAAEISGLAEVDHRQQAIETQRRRKLA